jgi:hypothetical protein
LRPASRYAIGASLHQRGDQRGTLLAVADPYLRWLAPARRPGDDFGWLPANPDDG